MPRVGVRIVSRGLPIACAAGFLAALAPAGGTPAPEQPPPPRPAARAPAAAELVVPKGFPVLGKWMYTTNGEPAHWLGEVYRGRRLREPINVLILDTVAGSEEDARVRLVAACASAGYPARRGHTSGYLGYIGTGFFPQLPEQQNHAFSDHAFDVDNNHGRVFGPAPLDPGDRAAGRGGYVFTGSFSRENIEPVSRVKHGYASFNRGRDEFTRRMDERTPYRIVDFAWLDNAVVSDPDFTTADHDGIAVVLAAGR